MKSAAQSAVLVTILVVVALVVVVSNQQRQNLPFSLQGGDTATPKTTETLEPEVAYPPPSGVFLSAITSEPRPTWRAMSVADIAEGKRKSYELSYGVSVALETIREFDSNDSFYLSSLLSPQRISDLPQSGSVVLVVLRIGDGATPLNTASTAVSYVGMLIHRDKGTLKTVEGPTLVSVLGHYPTAVP